MEERHIVHTLLGERGIQLAEGRPMHAQLSLRRPEDACLSLDARKDSDISHSPLRSGI